MFDGWIEVVKVVTFQLKSYIYIMLYICAPVLPHPVQAKETISSWNPPGSMAMWKVLRNLADFFQILVFVISFSNSKWM